MDKEHIIYEVFRFTKFFTNKEPLLIEYGRPRQCEKHIHTSEIIHIIHEVCHFIVSTDEEKEHPNLNFKEMMTIDNYYNEYKAQVLHKEVYSDLLIDNYYNRENLNVIKDIILFDKMDFTNCYNFISHLEKSYNNLWNYRLYFQYNLTNTDKIIKMRFSWMKNQKEYIRFKLFFKNNLIVGKY